jgi:hypothetical protein
MTNALASQAQQLQVAAASRDLTAIRPAPDQTVLFAAISTPDYDARVFFVDLIRLVLFLIDPSDATGASSISISSQLLSLPRRRSPPSARLTPAIRPN